MAIVLNPTSEEKIDLKDYVDYIKTCIDVNDECSLMDSANALKALKNNNNLVPNALNTRIEKMIDSDSNSVYSPTSIQLANEKDFYVRANIWLPKKEDLPLEEHRNKILATELPHNHNFGFLTIGYFGDGYTTDLYEIIDPDKIKGDLGEKVRLKNHQKLHLTPGKVILFRPFTDMHTQHAPKSLSVSINLVVKKPLDFLKPQYLFDLSDNTIAGMPDSIAYARRQEFLEMAVTLGNSNTLDLIQGLSERGDSEASNQAKRLLYGIREAT